MADSLLHTYQKIVPHLPKALISEAYRDRMAQVAALLPPVAITGLECRMHNADPRVDLSILVDPLLGEAAYWANEYEISTPQLDPSRFQSWVSIRRLCNGMLDHQSFMHNVIGHLALEFDLPPDQKKLSEPLFFALFRPLPAFVKLREAIVQKTLATVPNRFTQTVRNQVGICTTELPLTDQVYGIGWMPGRDENTIRYGIGTDSLEGLYHYLERIGWPGETAELQKCLDPLAPFWGHQILVGLDVSEEIMPRIGIELRIPPKRLPAFVALAVEMRICTPEKGQALLEWKALDEQATQEVACGLAYVKIVFLPGELLQMKAYLYFEAPPKVS